MKTKTTLLSLLMVGFAHSATLISTLVSPKLTSTVTFDNGMYNYKYVINSKPFDGKHELSHVTLNLCNVDFAFRYYGDDPFCIETTKHTVKFDNIDPRGDTFVFGYFSRNAPTETSAVIKASTSTYTDKVLTPKCIPETSTWLMSLLTLPLIFKRKNN